MQKINEATSLEGVERHFYETKSEFINSLTHGHLINKKEKNRLHSSFGIEKGITLIALVIMIIVLLILAGVTINTLTGENGIITQAQKAEEESEVAGEKEQIQLAVIQTMTNNEGKVEREKLKKAIEQNELKYESIIGDELITVILESGRVYEITGSGNVEYIGEKAYYTSEQPIMMQRDDNYAFWKEEYRTKITKIEVKPYIVKTSFKEIVQQWDISQKKNKSVIAYIVDSGNNEYQLFITANGETIAPNNCYRLFASFTKAKTVNLENLDTSNTTSIAEMFFSNVELEYLKIEKFDTSKVTNMTRMFSYCYKLKGLNVNKWDTSACTSMWQMFMECQELSDLDVSNFDTGKVTNMSGLFWGCINLTTLNVSNFNTENVVDMDGMFGLLRKVTDLDVSNFNTRKSD